MQGSEVLSFQGGASHRCHECKARSKVHPPVILDNFRDTSPVEHEFSRISALCTTRPLITIEGTRSLSLDHHGRDGCEAMPAAYCSPCNRHRFRYAKRSRWKVAYAPLLELKPSSESISPTCICICRRCLSILPWISRIAFASTTLMRPVCFLTLCLSKRCRGTCTPPSSRYVFYPLCLFNAYDADRARYALESICLFSAPLIRGKKPLARTAFSEYRGFDASNAPTLFVFFLEYLILRLTLS